MSDQENQLIREATGQGRDFRMSCEETLETEDRDVNNETGDQQGETSNAIPPAVRVALLVVLNHVEPGWENCVEVIRLWLEGARL